MASVWLDLRRCWPAAAVVLSLPAPPLALMATGSGRLALAACALLPAAILTAGPRLWPGWGRFGGFVLALPAVVTMVVPGFIALFVALFSLCGTDSGRSYLSTLGAILAMAGFAIPYLLSSAWAVQRPGRAMWAWPAAVLFSIACGIAVLGLAEDGPHHCPT